MSDQSGDDIRADTASLPSAQAAARDLNSREFRLLLAKQLVPIYLEYPVAVAKICDTVLDRSGALLGQVRALASRPAWEREATEEARVAKLDEALKRFAETNAPVWAGVDLEEYMNEIRERD